MSRISFIVNGWMTIVDLKKRFSPELHQLLGSDCPPKVWMIEMRHQHLASFLAPLQNHIQIVLHDIQDRVSTLWFQYLIQVGHVDVNRRGKIAVGDFLALQNQESIRLIEERRILAEGFQPDLQLSSILPALYPIGTKSSNILFISPDTAFVGKYIRPAFAALDDIVVRKHREVVSMVMIPIHDHFGIIVPITPKRMRMQVTLPPSRR